MTATRGQYSPKFKAKAAVEAIRGGRTLSHLASQHPAAESLLDAILEDLCDDVKAGARITALEHRLVWRHRPPRAIDLMPARNTGWQCASFQHLRHWLRCRRKRRKPRLGMSGNILDISLTRNARY